MKNMKMAEAQVLKTPARINVCMELKCKLPVDIKKAVRVVAAGEKKKTGMINFIFTGNKGIKKINLEYRMKNIETDVISFETAGDGLISGDVYISVEKAKTDAKSNGISFAEEITWLVMHGLLHIAGYDHKNSKDENTMLSKQRKYVKNMIKEKV